MSPAKRGIRATRATPRPKTVPRRAVAASMRQPIRDRIVGAALKLFQTRGFEGTTTKQIARAAKVAEGTVFNYFRTKEDIALHFFEQELDHAIATVRGDRRLRRAPLEERLFALVQNQLEYLAPHENFIGAALVQALRPTSKLSPLSTKSQELRIRYQAFVEELIEDAVEEGRLTSLARLTPHVFWLYYMGVLLFWLHDESPQKSHTTAFLDRSLKIGVAMLQSA